MPPHRPPQTKAELMGDCIPLNETQADIPLWLGDTVIGTRTAKKIGWQRE